MPGKIISLQTHSASTGFWRENFGGSTSSPGSHNEGAGWVAKNRTWFVSLLGSVARPFDRKWLLSVRITCFTPHWMNKRSLLLECSIHVQRDKFMNYVVWERVRGVMTVRNVKRINLHLNPKIDLFFLCRNSNFDCQVVWNDERTSRCLCWGVYGPIKSPNQQPLTDDCSRELIFREFADLIAAILTTNHRRRPQRPHSASHRLPLLFLRVARSLSASCNNNNDLIIP